MKLLSEHASGRSAKLDEELVHSLTAMVDQLKIGEARLFRAGGKQKWFVYTDASYEPETLTGGLAGVLLDSAGKLVSWFGLALASDMCKSLGGNFDLRVGALAAVLSLHLWCKKTIATFTFCLETMIVFAMLSSGLRALVVWQFLS